MRHSLVTTNYGSLHVETNIFDFDPPHAKIEQ